MKRDEFLNRVAQMCGPAEVAAVHQLAELPPGERYRSAQKLGQATADYGLMEFLTSLIDENLVDELASILPKGGRRDQADELLKRLWTRLLLMIGPEAKDVLYAHNQLRLMVDQRAAQPLAGRARSIDKAYQTALDNARAVLKATDDLDDEDTAPA
jgi:hypothetical protein